MAPLEGMRRRDMVAHANRLFSEETQKAFTELFHKDDHSNLIIECGDRKWNLNTAIVCARCKPFGAMISGNWKEGAEQKISLADDDPALVQHFLEYLYTGSYSLPEIEQLPSNKSQVEAKREASQANQGTLRSHIGLFALGEKYGIESLKLRAAGDFHSALNFILWEDLDAVIPEIYGAAPEHDNALREAMIDFMNAKQKQVRKLASSGFLKNNMVNINAFSNDLVRVLAREANE